LRPHICLFTALAPSHLLQLGTLKKAADCKAAALELIEPGGVAVLNRDMPYFKNIVAHARGSLRVVTYGSHAKADLRFVDIPPNNRLHAVFMDEEIDLPVSEMSSAMRCNMLGALGALWAAGYDWKAAAAALCSWKPLGGRGNWFTTPLGNGIVHILDEAYNANPGSMQEAMCYFADVRRGRRVVVLGEMAELGPEAEKYHTALAGLIKQHSFDKVHVTGALYKKFWKKIPATVKGCFAASVEELQTALLDDLVPEDSVLLKGSHSSNIHKIVSNLRAMSLKHRQREK
jgi:UDP-N-acetylmuramyl pentapeptide synthase